MNRKPIFDAVRKLLGRGFTADEVAAIDRAIDTATGALPANVAPEPPDTPTVPERKAEPRALGAAGEKLIKAWESCGRLRADGKYDAYPDPGSADGKPWTIGWGSTGADIARGTVWTKAQCDARFAQEIQRYAAEVERAIGDAPTSANQFDALVSFHYNTGAIFSASLTTLHKQGKFAQAAAEFGKWIYNNHKPMTGLVKRRAAEAKLYSTP
ncbi:lysozyme [Novosphingobium olei]|uniref:lysozyme n=1 Tax=Novosphingobium olei TaxID=2728851 RepID=UPI00308FEA18|nr:lysozyme [Novosphingobium olei]